MLDFLPTICCPLLEFLFSMKSVITNLLFILICVDATAQKIIEDYLPIRDSLQIGPGKTDYLPYDQKGYTLILPDSAAIRGVIISLEDSRANLNGERNLQIHPEATAKGFAVLYISTGIPVDLYFSESSLIYINKTIADIFIKNPLLKENVFFLGVSLSGHRSLKYIKYIKQRKEPVAFKIKGIVLCDGVLDWVRQWYEGKKGIRDNFATSSVFEGRLVTYLLEKNLGGTPLNALEKYLDFSMYSYFDGRARHGSYFKEYAMRAYTEPATLYWLEVKGKTTFDTNFPDQVGIINQQKLAGNTKVELRIFNQDKDVMDRRNPNYTWSLVNKTELVEWMVKLAD